MFCLDYALIFIVHYRLRPLVTAPSASLASPAQSEPSGPSDLASSTLELSSSSSWPSAVSASTLTREAFVGSVAGLTAAVALWPFDALRQSAVGGMSRASFAWSSMPFAAAYLGIFFSLAPPEREVSLQARACVALGAAFAATAVEFPLDRARLAIAGGHRRLAVFSAAARIPLSALMLVAYDHFARARVHPDVAQTAMNQR
mmetsp:Transcript_17793/g.35157  ORF Transcript_17793/g.35157 Transcript_17793/m.35157 type:complete len:202 (-) Transcript_17793:557-1162(-)|eukprot:CAMPEP_0171500176 /NCGR_PEP_ID=MMETSP0958-20121227/8841_1 /TAXON_ID=87120 /ORGANISM="Aurantiochytrium limacinum, Strain ATCCMYA-1381" /LENGTH=201 /DNA_ID=CAMNT_0012034819 /DNA_START=124 /DNA_END=729 /DNA_ORIENTATION=+